MYDKRWFLYKRNENIGRTENIRLSRNFSVQNLKTNSEKHRKNLFNG